MALLGWAGIVVSRPSTRYARRILASSGVGARRARVASSGSPSCGHVAARGTRHEALGLALERREPAAQRARRDPAAPRTPRTPPPRGAAPRAPPRRAPPGGGGSRARGWRSSAASDSAVAGRSREPRDDPEPVLVDEGAEPGEEVASIGPSLGPRARLRLPPMLPNGRRLGAHLPLGDGMVKAADRAAEIGASALQVFTDNPASWRRRDALPAGLPAFRDRLAAHGIAPLAIHASYLVNLAGPIRRAPRPLDRAARPRAARRARVRGGVRQRACRVAPRRRRRGGLARLVARAQPPTLAAVDAGREPVVVLVLENGSGGGYGLGTTIEELPRSTAALEAGGVTAARFGFCLDVAHLWGAGYAIDTAAGVDAAIAAFDAASGSIGCGWSTSTTRARSWARGTDRHEHVGAGRIGADGLGAGAHPPALDARRRTCSRRRAWTRARTRSTSPASATSPKGGRSPTSRPRRSRPAARRAAVPPPRTPSRWPARDPDDGRRGSARRRRRRPGAANANSARAARARRLHRILILAALTRLPGIDARGQWDADQGTDMLVLRALRRATASVPAARPQDLDRQLPPRRRLLLAARPRRVPDRRDPVAVDGRARAVRDRGRRGDLVARPGSLADPSPRRSPGCLRRSRPPGSTSPPSSGTRTRSPCSRALAFAARSWRGAPVAPAGGSSRAPARWSRCSSTSSASSSSCRWRGPGRATSSPRRPAIAPRAALRGGLGAIAIVAAGYLPLLASELSNDFAETRAILDYLAGGGREAAGGRRRPDRHRRPPVAHVAVRRRDHRPRRGLAGRRRCRHGPVRRRGPPAARRRPATPAGAGSSAGSPPASVALALFAPEPRDGRPGPPNDHYHDLLDPIVLALAGMGSRDRGPGRSSRLRRATTRRAGLAALVARPRRGLGHGLAPGRRADGGWPLADQAATRV